MQNDASTYRDMYEGPVVFGDGSADSDNVYWYGGVAYEITMTHKQALDKPTVTCRIPAALLSVETPSAAALSRIAPASGCSEGCSSAAATRSNSAAASVTRR